VCLQILDSLHGNGLIIGPHLRAYK